jgi:hypothetical protein
MLPENVAGEIILFNGKKVFHEVNNKKAPN